MFFVYSILLGLSFIILAPFFIFKILYDKKYLEGIFERFGCLSEENKNKKIWIHTVSVGEFLIALPIIKKIKQEFPNLSIVVTTTTKTGNNLAKQKLKNTATVLYSPIDFSFIVKKFIKIINPLMLIIVETEIWPNLIRKNNQNKVPIVLINGRISDKSLKGYSNIKFFVKKVLYKIENICVRSKNDFDRFKLLGAKEGQITITGNIKFDIQPENILSKENLKCSLPIDLKSKIIVAGSTHDKEEEFIIKTFQFLQKDKLQVSLVLVPRHPERIKKIEALLVDYKLSYIRKSQIENNKNEFKYSVILVDTIGELFSLYSIADLVFVGGSMIPHGGHNIIEPAYFGVPIVFGKHMSNFREVSELFLKENAGVMVASQEELNKVCLKILTDHAFSKIIGANAINIIKNNQGAVDKNFEIIKKFIK